MSGARDEHQDDIGIKALRRLWRLVIGRVDEARIALYRLELKRHTGAIIERAVDQILRDQTLTRIPPVGRMDALCRTTEAGPANEPPRLPTPIIQAENHIWYPAIKAKAKAFDIAEHQVYESETARQIKAGYDPQTATVLGYGAAVMTRQGGGEQLGRQVQNWCGSSAGVPK